MPTTGGQTDMMGFMGLQTQSSNTLPEKIQTALFTNFSGTCDTVSSPTIQRTGSLYAYGSREALAKEAQKRNTATEISDLALYIDKQTGVFRPACEAIAQEKDATKQKQLLIDYIKGDGTATYDNILTPLASNFYQGYNKLNSTTTPTLELGVPGSGTPHSYNFYDGAKSEGPSERVRVLQFNKADITKSDTNQDVYAHLGDIMGTNLVDYLLVQAAMDTSVQSDVITTVIKLAYANTGGKLVVYDRRFNDQLGSS
jgi:hypothetical protein